MATVLRDTVTLIKACWILICNFSCVPTIVVLESECEKDYFYIRSIYYKNKKTKTFIRDFKLGNIYSSRLPILCRRFDIIKLSKFPCHLFRHNGVNIWFPIQKDQSEKIEDPTESFELAKYLAYNPRGYPHLLSRTKVHVLRDAASRHFNEGCVAIRDVATYHSMLDGIYNFAKNYRDNSYPKITLSSFIRNHVIKVNSCRRWRLIAASLNV